MRDTIVFTVGHGEESEKLAEMCEKTFRVQNPEIPFLLVGRDNYHYFARSDEPAWMSEVVSLRTIVGLFLAHAYKRVVYLDADLFVCGRLDELVRFDGNVLLTRDVSDYDMQVPDLPILNSGVLAACDRAFWENWCTANHSVLLPAVKKFFFNQLSLRLMIANQKDTYSVLEEVQKKIYYNVAVREHEGEWRVEDGKVFKGSAEVKIYHQAGEPVRGLEGLPASVCDYIKSVLEKSLPEGPKVDLEQLFSECGDAFSKTLENIFRQMPLMTLDHLFEKYYQETPNLFRSTAPLYWDRFREIRGTGFQRILSTSEPPFFLYSRIDK